LRSMLPSLVMDGALPILTFTLLTRAGVSMLYALVAGGVFPAINIARQWAKSQRLDPLGIIVIGFLALGAAASLISGSVFFVLVKESFLTATFGLLCLVSLLAERPLMFYISRQFVPDQSWWDGLWQYPTFQAMMRKITVVWGVGYILEATARVGLVMVLSPALIVVISPVMMFGVIIGLTVWTRRTLFAARERRIRELQSGSPA
jgi:intracellular septation protein A